MLVDRNPLDRGFFDRGFVVGTPVRELAGYIDSESANYGQIVLTIPGAGYIDSESNGYGHTLVGTVIRGYGIAEEMGYGHLFQGHVVSGYVEADADGYLSPSFFLVTRGYGESEADGFARLMQDLRGYVEPESEVYGFVPNPTRPNILRLDRGAIDRKIAYPHPVKELAGYTDSTVAGYGRSKGEIVIRGYTDNESDGYGYIVLGLYPSGHAESESIGYGIAVKYEFVMFTVTAPLSVGETLIVNGEEYIVTIDGTNAISGFSGDWPRLIPGTNTVTYADTESGRTVLVTVSKKARQL